MASFKTWISALRLRTLPLSVSGIVVAGSLAEYNGLFQWDIFIMAILTTLSFQILSNLANDYGDGVKGTDNMERIGPERAIQSGLISPASMFVAIRMNILISIFLAVFTIYVAFGSKHFFLGLLFLVLGMLSIYAALKYTIGNNAYGYRGLGDLFVFVFFGLLSVIGAYVLFAKQIDHVTFLPAITIGLLSTAVLNLNNLRDIESDIKSQKITMAVKMGFVKAKQYHLFLVGGALFASVLFGVLYYYSPFNLLFFLAFIPLIKHMITVYKCNEPILLDQELKKLALSTFLLSVLLAVGHIL